MDSLLERIEENRLDALYLFINEALRDRRTFDVFLQNLVTVLPLNWSIQRVEVGHEFLSMVSNQDDLFELICGLESLRTLIISDGYVPRKDNGTVQTEALLSSLPKARNLINLDLQRLFLADKEQVQMLEDVFESMSESLEEIRITGLVVDPSIETVSTTEEIASSSSRLPLDVSAAVDGDRVDLDDESDTGMRTNRSGSRSATPGVLDGPIAQCVDMGNLRSLAISQKQKSEQEDESSSAVANESRQKEALLVSRECLLDLCRSSTTLQDLALRNMNLDNPTCETLAEALTTSSFLTSLDLRQNEDISNEGYSAILQALERNHDLWCTVMVDNESFQAKFNSLIELNQANRADLIRNPTRSKLATFIGQLNESSYQQHPRGGGATGSDPTALWYFLSIHDTILFPLVDFWQWKRQVEGRSKGNRKRQANESASNGSVKKPKP